jgi:ankyrin repeat protein
VNKARDIGRSTMHIELINHLTKARLHKLILDADEFALEIFILQYQDAIAENLIFDDYFNTVIDDQYNSTALHLAVLTDNVTILKMVIAAGADPNQQLENDIAAIHLAAFRNKLNALAYLIRIKVNLDLHSLLDDFTAVMYATSANNGDAITLLYDAKANLNERTAEGITAVYIATENDYMESLAALIAGNADVKIPDVHGFAPIHKAAERDNYYALVRLINAGANVNARSNSINGRVTALFIAVNGRHFNSVAVILQSGKAKLNYRYGPQAITALFRAVVLISPEIFSLLLYYNANPFLPAYFHNDELSLRRLVRWMRVNNNSPELQQINSILRSLPKFPAYPESGNFRFESHSNEAPALNNITQGTTLAINHSADTQSDIHASVSLTDISLLSFTNPISRSTSFCTYDSNDLYQFTHTKRNDLGKGSLGSVYLMTPNYLNNTKLAVKEIKPLNLATSKMMKLEKYYLILIQPSPVKHI